MAKVFKNGKWVEGTAEPKGFYTGPARAPHQPPQPVHTPPATKVFKDGKWVEGPAKPYSTSPAPVLVGAKVFKDGKWVSAPDVVVAAPGNPRDTEPLPPAPPANDADRPRWVSENVRYLEALGEHRNHLAFKATHPELRGKGWN
jgi:hypothetical protein